MIMRTKLSEPTMLQSKIKKNQHSNNEQLMREYIKVMKRAPVIFQSEYNSSSLKQPSLLEEVDSFTTYEVSATIQEWK